MPSKFASNPENMTEASNKTTHKHPTPASQVELTLKNGVTLAIAGMHNPSVDLASFVALPSSNHGFEAVPSVIGRCSTSRVRQRPPSSRQQAAARTPVSTMLRDRNQQQRRMPNDSCNDSGGVGAGLRQGGAKGSLVPIFDGRSDATGNGSSSRRSSSRRSSSSTSSSTSISSSSSSNGNSNNNNSNNKNNHRDADVYQSRNRMVAAGKRRRWTDVLEILGRWEELADRLDVKTYNVALSTLGKCGRWKEALSTLDRMRSKGVLPDVYSFNGAISACGRAGKWQQALALLENVEREGCGVRPDIFSYNGAINAVAKAGRWEKALELLSRIETRRLVPDVISFTTAMSACGRAGEWQHALDIMDLMLERDIEPNIVTYGTAINACARGGRWHRALSLLEDMPSRGVEPNAHTYGSAIHACVVGGERKRALSLLEEMMQRGVPLDSVAFNAAMSAVDGWAAALRLLEVMEREGVLPDLVTYNTALGVIARSGREDVALALLNHMRMDGYTPDLVSFNTAIDACASREKWQEAVQLLEVDMPGAKVKPDVISFTSVIHACAGPHGNWEKAYALLDSMWQDTKGAKPNKRTYDLVIQACGHGGEWELGVALIDDMRDLGIKPDAQTFNIAVAACARSGERLAAETLVANMLRAGVTPDEFTYASLVAACGRAGEWKRATEIFDEARYIRHIRPSLHIYGALISSLASGEKWAEVLTYLDRMAADGVVPDVAATNTGVLAAAELGDGLLALTLLEGQQRRSRDDAGGDGENMNKRAAYGEKLGEAVRGGRGEGVGVAGVSATGAGTGALALAAAAEAGAAAGADSGAATATAASTPLETQAGDIGRPWVAAGERRIVKAGGCWEAATPGLLNSVLHALGGNGEDAAVLKAVKRARDEGVLLNASIYRCALKACGNLGDYSRANELLLQMVEEKLTPDIVHWNHALRASAASARWEQARSLLREMQEFRVTPDAFSYSMVLKACSAGLWSGDSWIVGDGWGVKEESLHPCARGLVDDRQEVKGGRREVPPCRGRHAIEMLQEMENKGIHVCGQSFTLAMAACLEAHRDNHTESKLKSPSEADTQLSRDALSLFDRMVEAGEAPTASSYALALKACARTANARRASSLFFDLLGASVQASWRNTSGNVHAVAHEGPPLEVRPWHLASAVAAYDAAGDWAGAKQLWGEALGMGVSPRSPGYEAVIAAAARAGDVTAARVLAKEARGLRLELGSGTAVHMRGEGGDQVAPLLGDADEGDRDMAGEPGGVRTIR